MNIVWAPQKDVHKILRGCDRNMIKTFSSEKVIDCSRGPRKAAKANARHSFTQT
jgi:hypothetical protein